MSDENVGGLVELLPCPFCGSQPKLETHSQYHSYSARDAQRDGMGVSAGGFSTTSWRVDCACGISIPGNNDAFLVQRWNTRALSAHGQPVVDAYLIERVLNTRVPGGSLVWWSINGGGMGIDDGHRNVVRRVLEAYLSMKGSTP